MTTVISVISAGPQGAPGPAGPQGIPGAPGPSGGDTYVFTQVAPTATWDITHNLQRMPSVTVVDSAGSTVEGAIDYIDNNRLVVSFSAGFAGQAFLN